MTPTKIVPVYGQTATTVVRLTNSHITAIQSNDLLHRDIEGTCGMDNKGFDTNSNFFASFMPPSDHIYHI